MEERHRLHVLVVDDQAPFRELLKRILEPAGYEVLTATDAHTALRSIAERPPAVAVCDIHMPGPDGLWLASQIRVTSPTTAIVLATSDDTVPPAESLRPGIVAYVLKPLQRDAVLTAVATAFRWFATESGQEVPVRLLEPEIVRAPAVPVQKQEASPRSTTWRWLVTAALLAVSPLPAIQWLRTKPARMLSRIAAGSGSVVVADASGMPLAQGSGFFITPDTFVTNHHVVNGGSVAKITTGEGRALKVSGVVAFDRRNDLILLKTTGLSSSRLDLVLSPPAVGDDISVYGAPLGLQGTLSTGIVSAERPDQQGMLQISAPISPGSSGSPVINTDGEVVGVVVASRVEGQGLNFAIPAVRVDDLLSHAGEPRPLIVAARGAGDDLERNQLIGPVRKATEFSSEPYLVARERLRKTFAGSMPAAEATRMAERKALQGAKTVLIFDRRGRLIEKTLGDDMTRMQYAYDEDGLLKAAEERVGDRVLIRWNFAQAGPRVLEALSAAAGGQAMRRIRYTDDGRLLSDETWNGDRAQQSTQWTYHGAGWPIAKTMGEASDPPDAVSPAVREEYDPIGNVTHRISGDGAEVFFDYRLDARGNWVSREMIRVDAHGTRAVVARQRREIEYW